MWSGSTTCLRSTSTPLAALIASTTSAGPIEPNSRPPAAARADDRDDGARQQRWPAPRRRRGPGPRAGPGRVAWARPAPRPLAGHDGPPLGKQVVAGEPAGDLDDVASPPDAGDVVPQQHLHRLTTRGTLGVRHRRRPRRAASSAISSTSSSTSVDHAASVSGSPRPSVSSRTSTATRARRASAAAACRPASARPGRPGRATPARPLGHGALGVGQQHQLAGRLDGQGHARWCWAQLPDTRREPDLAPVAHVLAQHRDVLVVDPLDPVPAQGAGLLLDPPPESFGARRADPPRWLLRAIRRAPRRIRIRRHRSAGCGAAARRRPAATAAATTAPTAGRTLAGPRRSFFVIWAVAQRSDGPISSATTSTLERLSPSWVSQLRCSSRPATMTRAPRVIVSLDVLGHLAPAHDVEEGGRLLPLLGLAVLPPPVDGQPEASRWPGRCW